MNARFSIFTIMIALTVLISACSPQATPTTQPATPMPAATQASALQVPAAAGPSGPAHVVVGKTSKFSSLLVDDKGMTLYLYTKDTPNTTTCYAKCPTAWPPLLTNGAPVAGDGADASKIGITTRTDGSTQVTYNGWPLYYFAKDSQAGDTTGQSVGSVWFVVSATGDALK